MCPGSHAGSVAKSLTVKSGLEGFISDSFYPFALKTSENPGHLFVDLTDVGILEFQRFNFWNREKDKIKVRKTLI